MEEYFCPKCGAWFCDSCGVLLNRQDGFSDSYDSWTCTECRKILYHYDNSEPYYINVSI